MKDLDNTDISTLMCTMTKEESKETRVFYNFVEHKVYSSKDGFFSPLVSHLFFFTFYTEET